VGELSVYIKKKRTGFQLRRSIRKGGGGRGKQGKKGGLWGGLYVDFDTWTWEGEGEVSGRTIDHSIGEKNRGERATELSNRGEEQKTFCGGRRIKVKKKVEAWCIE